MPDTEERCIRWLHFTDLHVGQPKEWDRYPNIAKALLEDLKIQAAHGWSWDVVFFTGDLAFKGTHEEYAVVTGRLRRILDQVAELSGGRYPLLLAVPGNHDLTRLDDKTRRLLSCWDRDESFRRGFWTDTDHELRQAVERAFTGYRQWLDTHPFPVPPNFSSEGLLPGDFAATLTIRGIRLGVVGLNMAFLHQQDGAQGKLAVHQSQLRKLCGADYTTWTDGHHANILLTHHPADWLDEASRRAFDTEIQHGDRFAAHLYGHLHAGAYRAVAARTGFRHAFQGRSLFAAEEEGYPRLHGYSMGRLVLSRQDEGWQRSLELWTREAVLLRNDGWSFGDSSHAGDRAWWVAAKLGAADAPGDATTTDATTAPPPPIKAIEIPAGGAPPDLPLAERAILLSASVPASDQRLRPGEEAYVRSARPGVIRQAVRALGRGARDKGWQIVFGGHPTIAETLLPLANDPGREAAAHPWLLLFVHERYRNDSEHISALATLPGVQLVWVAGPEQIANRPPREAEWLEALRVRMVSLGHLVAGVFVGGKDGIKIEFDLMGQKQDNKPRYALGCGGAAAAEISRDNPTLARGGLADSSPLWFDAETAVQAVFDDLAERGAVG